MAHVLIATDGSDLARHAAEQALGLLPRSSEVTIVSVVTPTVAVVPAPGAILGVPDPLGSDATASLMREAEAAVAGLARVLGLGEARTRVLSGQPGPELCRLAAEEGAEVLVVGSHGRGVLKRVLLGSVSDHVVHHCPCPVLVVRRPVDGEPGA